MEPTTISTFWDIAKEGGWFGILFITNVLLWLEKRKKEEQFLQIILSLERISQETSQINKSNEMLTSTLINLLTKK